MWNPATLYPAVLATSDVAMAAVAYSFGSLGVAALVGVLGVSVVCATALGDPLTDTVGSGAGPGLKS
ncbi:hypothetical protein [Halorientalis sp.]|jgi:hypothetical protein|uniref:hypothetical protein n=1 Tax=Halorientalis sp. TaxID=1931229 RepID=UPI00261696D5|nr:hypothetical protein [Halorientalis sp.]